MTTVLYRKSSGEVLAISPGNQTWEIDEDFYGILSDPSLPDGNQTREITTNEEGLPVFGPARALGYAKMAIPASSLVRNATQLEIDTWDDLEGIDEKAEDTARARVQLQNNPMVARAFKALIRMIIDNEERANARYNELLGQWSNFRDAMANDGITIAQIRNGFDSLVVPNPLPETYNFSQILQNLLDDIRENDAPRRRDRL